MNLEIKIDDSLGVVVYFQFKCLVHINDLNKCVINTNCFHFFLFLLDKVIQFFQKENFLISHNNCLL